MKTPREVLLGRHQDATAKLDAVRRSVVNGIARSAATPTSRTTNHAVIAFAMKIWQELIWPSRGAWATIAILWVGVLAWNIAESSSLTAPEGKRTRATSHLAQDLAAQRRLLSELLEPTPLRPPEPARTDAQPRTEFVPPYKLC